MLFGMRRRRGPRPPRNTAPAWKKITIVLSAPVSAGIVVALLHADKWSFLPFLALVIAVAAGAVWATAKVLGVHLSLSSWD